MKCNFCKEEIYRLNIAPFTWRHASNHRAPCGSFATPEPVPGGEEVASSKDNEMHPRFVAHGRGFCWSGNNYGEADAVVKRNGNGCVYVSEHLCDKHDERQIQEDEKTERMDGDNYVAWCRYTYDGSGGIRSIQTCDSDAKGAFKVYRHPTTTPALTDEQATESAGHPGGFPPWPGIEKFMETKSVDGVWDEVTRVVSNVLTGDGEIAIVRTKLIAALEAAREKGKRQR